MIRSNVPHLDEPVPRMQCFQALLYRLNVDRTLGPWRAIFIDTQSGPPSVRAKNELISAWYGLIWQHNSMLGRGQEDLLITARNCREFTLALVPLEWYRTENWIKRRETSPEAFTFAPDSVDVALLDHWKTITD